jgi:hypothetical protein
MSRSITTTSPQTNELSLFSVSKHQKFPHAQQKHPPTKSPTPSEKWVASPHKRRSRTTIKPLRRSHRKSPKKMSVDDVHSWQQDTSSTQRGVTTASSNQRKRARGGKSEISAPTRHAVIEDLTLRNKALLENFSTLPFIDSENDGVVVTDLLEFIRKMPCADYISHHITHDNVIASHHITSHHILTDQTQSVTFDQNHAVNSDICTVGQHTLPLHTVTPLR